jgi:hypothetical protein
LLTERFTVLAVCRKAVVSDVFVALRLLTERFTVLAVCRKAVVSEALVADKFAAYTVSSTELIELKTVQDMFNPPDLFPMTSVPEEFIDEVLIPL